MPSIPAKLPAGEKQFLNPWDSCVILLGISCLGGGVPVYAGRGWYLPFRAGRLSAIKIAG